MWRHKDLKRPRKLVLSKGFFFNLVYGFVDETKLLTEFIYFIMARDSERVSTHVPKEDTF